MVDNDDNESYSDIEDHNEDKSGDESDMDVEELRESDSSIYSIWKSNAQYLYDLLLHNHTSWPSSSCTWGPILNIEYLTPVSPLSQRLYLATHTDGSYNAGTKKWSNTPECIILASVEMTRRRGTQTWYIAKYNESQRNRNFVTLKHIVHPGTIGRMKVIPDTEWLVSHSIDSRLYFWNSKTQKNHSARDGTDASVPDICLTTCNGDKLTEYPLAIYSRKKAMYVREVEVPLMPGSKITPPEFYEPPKDSGRKSVKRGGGSKRGGKKMKKNNGKEEEVEVKEEEEKVEVKEEEKEEEKESEKEEEKEVKEEEEVEEEEKESEKEEEMEEEGEMKEEEEEKEEEKDEVEVKEEEEKESEKEEEEKEEEVEVKEEEKEVKEEESEKEVEVKEEEEMKEEEESAKEEEMKEEEEEEEEEKKEEEESAKEDEKEEEKEEMTQESPSFTDSIEYRVLCVSKNTLHLWNMHDLSSSYTSLSQAFNLTTSLTEDNTATTIEDICFLDGYDKSGKLVGIAGTHGFVGIFDVEKQAFLWKNTTEHKSDVHCIVNISTADAYQHEPYKNMEKYLITCGEDNHIVIWNIDECINKNSQTPVFYLETSSSVLCIDYCPQIPRYIVVGTESGEIDMFDLLAKGAEEYLVLKHLGHRTAVNDIQFDPYELLTVLSCSDDNDLGGGSIQIWRPHELLMVKVESNDDEKNEAVDEILRLLKK